MGISRIDRNNAMAQMYQEIANHLSNNDWTKNRVALLVGMQMIERFEKKSARYAERARRQKHAVSCPDCSEVYRDGDECPYCFELSRDLKLARCLRKPGEEDLADRELIAMLEHDPKRDKR